MNICAKHKKYREKQKLSIKQAIKVNHACLINKKKVTRNPCKSIWASITKAFDNPLFE